MLSATASATSLTTSRRLVFWQQEESPHQAALLAALANRVERTWLSTAGGVPRARKKLGWETPEFGSVVKVRVDGVAKMDQVMADVGPGAVHVVSGLWTGSLARRAADLFAQDPRCTWGIMAEAGDWRGVAGALRRLRARRDHRAVGRFAKFFLAMGETGERWYCQAGYDPKRVFQFGYFVDAPGSVERVPRGEKVFAIVYVGRLEEQKGVDILIGALGCVPSMEWRLVLVGDGRLRRGLERLTVRLGLGPRVHFVGSHDRKSAIGLVAHADLLVLPSRYDGWGAVVNEALLSGTPVICTNGCGASVLLGGTTRGDVVAANSIFELSSALANRVSAGTVTENTRASIRSWASAALSGDRGADYFLKILDHVEERGPRPQSPWLEVG